MILVTTTVLMEDDDATASHDPGNVHGDAIG